MPQIPSSYDRLTMSTRTAPPPARAAQDALEIKAKLFRGLAEPSRLVLLELMREGERSVGDLVATSGLSQANVSAHLACLRDCGLVSSRSEGRYVFYRIAGREVERMLAHADGALAALAARIAACVSYRR